MKRLSLFKKIFIYTFSVFSTLVICLHLAIYFLFPTTYLSHRQESIGQKATEIAQTLQGKDSQTIQEVLELYSQSSDIKGSIKGEMTQDKLEVKDNLPIDKERQTASLVIEEREIQSKDGQTLTIQFIASMDLQKEAEDISLQFLPYTLLASFLISLLIAYIYARTIVAPILEIKRVYQHLLTVIADLHEKNEAILQLEKMKVEFLRGASHELKTPLASLKILLENMKANIGRYKDRDHYLGVSLGIVDDLSHHVQQILSLSSVQELRDKKEEINLLDMTNLLLKDYDLLAKERKISVENQLTDQHVYLNPSVLKLILSNLISNAVKHSVQGGYLKIGTEDDWFFIENTCTTEEQDKFEQSFTTSSRQSKGAGLGLFVVKSLLENEEIDYYFERDENHLVFFMKLPQVNPESD